jgi:hypothetical protein
MSENTFAKTYFRERNVIFVMLSNVPFPSYEYIISEEKMLENTFAKTYLRERNVILSHTCRAQQYALPPHIPISFLKKRCQKTFSQKLPFAKETSFCPIPVILSNVPFLLI